MSFYLLSRTLAVTFSTGFFLGILSSVSWGAEFTTSYPKAQIQGLNGWNVSPIFSVGEVLPSSLDPEGYVPMGALDGVGAVRQDREVVRVYVNHELPSGIGSPYTLSNGTQVRGSRISFFDFDRKSAKIRDSGLAFQTILDRQFVEVTDPKQINEKGNGIAGLLNLCSGHLVIEGEYHFEDTIFFTHEEGLDPQIHPHGGSLWALDTRKNALSAVPSMGRFSAENSAPLETFEGHIAMLIGDDASQAPLWLFLGKKGASIFDIKEALPRGVSPPSDNFLNRNGLLVGDLYYFVPDNQYRDVSEFSGTGSVMRGSWNKIRVLDEAMAGQQGYDRFGYKNGQTLRSEAFAGGAFKFIRPEDVSTNPHNPIQAVLTSTGSGQLYNGIDTWGTLFLITVNFLEMRSQVKILYDGDDAGGGQFPHPDFGIRSPDNTDWGDDGFIYLQEDPATPKNTFGRVSGREASVWRVSPGNGKILRIGEVDRSVVVPKEVTDNRSLEIGAWESSGILDVTRMFANPVDTLNFYGHRYRKRRLLIGNIQAHSLRDGPVLQKNLWQGGQLVFFEHDEP